MDVELLKSQWELPEEVIRMMNFVIDHQLKIDEFWLIFKYGPNMKLEFRLNNCIDKLDMGNYFIHKTDPEYQKIKEEAKFAHMVIQAEKSTLYGRNKKLSFSCYQVSENVFELSVCIGVRSYNLDQNLDIDNIILNHI